MSIWFIPVLGYLLGSIPFGLVIGRLWRAVDIRKFGSGNIGTSNVMRTVGRLPAIIVLLLDVLKGSLPVWIALSIDAPPYIVAAAALSAVVGHIFPWVLRFQGGKGIATAFGAAIALDLRIAGILVAIWLLVLLVTRFISVASIGAAIAFPVAIWAFGAQLDFILAASVIALIAIYRHRSNISRLIRGKEFRFGEKAATGAGHR